MRKKPRTHFSRQEAEARTLREEVLRERSFSAQKEAEARVLGEELRMERKAKEEAEARLLQEERHHASMGVSSIS